MLPLLALLFACGPKPIPEHLRLDRPQAEDVASVEVHDLQSALDAILGRDPLGRSPRLPDPARLTGFEGDEAVRDFVQTMALVQRDGDSASRLGQLEDRWRGTAAVGLSRGYRLRVAEDRLARDPAADPDTQLAVLALLSPLSPGAAKGDHTTSTLSWLAGSEPVRAAVLAWGEDWVLRGWLDGPEVPLAPIAARLDATQFDAVRDSALGRLVVARAEGRSAPLEEGMADLERATVIALHHSAADRDREQAAWSAYKKEVAAELEADDPLAFLLDRAADRLTEAAGDDRAAGSALLALEAARWRGACEKREGIRSEAICRGLDRVDGMRAAGRWDPEVERLAQTWRVIALKDAVDAMDVGHESVLFPSALVQLVDALIGTGGGPLDARLLQFRKPDPTVWLALGRAAGGDGTTDWTSARAALGIHLRKEAERALTQTEDPDARKLLERIAQRAVP